MAGRKSRALGVQDAALMLSVRPATGIGGGHGFEARGSAPVLEDLILDSEFLALKLGYTEVVGIGALVLVFDRPFQGGMFVT